MHETYKMLLISAMGLLSLWYIGLNYIQDQEQIGFIPLEEQGKLDRWIMQIFEVSRHSKRHNSHRCTFYAVFHEICLWVE